MPIAPQGFPIMLTFDLDAETLWTARDPKNAERPITLSQGSYGWKVGMGRILDLLDRYDIKATFFVPGIVIQQRQALIEETLKRGHEIGHHSWSHAWIVNLTPEQEREEMQRRVELLHRHWTRDREYLAPPESGQLADLDPALIVTPPEGLEVGYVPIVTRQEPAPTPAR